ncbi:MAG: HAD family hydrolase [Cyanobacteria bacterium J06554_11]
MAIICCKGRRFESIQAVLFDKDGTLARVEAYLAAVGMARWQLLCREETDLAKETATGAITPLLSAFGMCDGRVDPAGLLAVGSRWENEVAAAAYLAAAGWDWITALNTAQAAFSEAACLHQPKAAKTPLIENVRPLLTRLSEVGIKAGIVSADLQSEVTAFIEYNSLAEISWCCGASASTLPKIHPDFLQFACDAMGAAPSETLIVGDSAADLALARQGAAGFLGMTGGWSLPPRIGPDVVAIARFSEVECMP